MKKYSYECQIRLSNYERFTAYSLAVYISLPWSQGTTVWLFPLCIQLVFFLLRMRYPSCMHKQRGTTDNCAHKCIAI